MAEPPYKRARRPDSKQMWEESDRRAPVQSRERDDRRDGHDRGGRDDRRDRDRERDRRYRSRSPRGRDDRNRGGRREERGDRGGGRGRDDREEKGGRRRDDGGRGGRDRDRERERGEFIVGGGDLSYRIKSNVAQDGGRNSKHERSRSRDRRRSRSPRRERERDADIRKDTEQDKPKVLKPAEEEFTKSRTATPPVSFRVGRATSYEAPDHEKMDTDDDAKPLKIKGAKSKKVVEEPEEDEEIVVEDDGMAAMQAMMGFGGFGTTHQKKVAGNEVYAVRKEKKTEYRQYMNRVGGFNRPLSPSHES